MSAPYRCRRCGALVASGCCDKCPSGEDGQQHDPGQAYAPKALAERDMRNDVAAEADRIEADNAAHPEWPRLTVEETWHGCNSALDDAKTARGTAEQHHYLVRLAAWAMVALRAEAREQTSAKGGEHG